MTSVVRRRTHPARFLLVATAVAVLAPAPACRRGARPAPAPAPSSAAPSAPRPARARPQGSPHLAWVSDWNGSSPTLLASAGGQLAIAVFGAAALGTTAIGAGNPPRLSLMRIGADRRPGRIVDVAPALAWAHPLALLDDGGLVIDGPQAGAGAAALLRTRADGSVAWAQSLPAGTYAGAIAADLAADTVAVVVGTGLRSVDARGYFPIKSSIDQPSEELRVYDAGGKLRFSSRLASARRISTTTIALRPSDGAFLAGGHFAGDLRIDSGGAPPASASQPGPEDTAWIAAWDASGRVAWLRSFAGRNPSLHAIHPLGNGGVLVIGWCYGRLSNMDGVPDVDGGADAGHRDAGAPTPNQQVSFFVRLDGATGAPLSIKYLDGARTTTGLDDGLIEVASSDIRDGERAYVTTVSDASDATGDNRWRAALDAQVYGVAAASDAVLVSGRYNVVMTLPGHEPPAVLTGAGSERAFVGLLAWQGDVAAAPPPARADDLHARAMRAFRRKRYHEACDLFAGAQVARPASAANMADLALCLERAADREGATRANRYAIRLAEAPGIVDEEKSLRVRKAAYHNLGRLNPGGWRRALVPDFGCAREVFFDTRNGTTGGIHYLADFEMARFALDEETATLGDDEYKLEWPPIGADDGATDDTGGNTSYDVTLSLEEDFRDSEGNTEEASSAGCQLVHADGCSGHLGFSCDFAPRGESTASARTIELTLKPAPAK